MLSDCMSLLEMVMRCPVFRLPSCLDCATCWGHYSEKPCGTRRHGTARPCCWRDKRSRGSYCNSTCCERSKAQQATAGEVSSLGRNSICTASRRSFTPTTGSTSSAGCVASATVRAAVQGSKLLPVSAASCTSLLAACAGLTAGGKPWWSDMHADLGWAHSGQGPAPCRLHAKLSHPCTATRPHSTCVPIIGPREAFSMHAITISTCVPTISSMHRMERLWASMGLSS